ncbi:GNAT family N-acetyltransferase [Arcticibacterium luteifluviistationis]|uniref:GNAT family N-acetyltransferase n=1 Tax=Arcticibacterium luteifluviistationis TaxID=1784714 RepID=A0A2Z4GDU7_9BACT|nr:GNAT family protein [Arcticibacterium luteifluviistationis]AWV99083.1 GNAT family N-acetyltransferase [Arcticibacterium luteifluviistationis]
MKIEIRPLEPTDVSNLAALANNQKIWEDVRDYFPFPYTEKDAEWFINHSLEMTVNENFAITYNGDFCGVISANIQTDVYRKSAEMGYWIGEPFWGKGIATEAVKLIITYAFENLGVNRIFSSVFEYNLASMKVLEKNGFVKEGVFRKAIFKKEQLWDEHKYAKLA